MEDECEITADALLKKLYDVRPYVRAQGAWTMSQETHGQILERLAPLADRNRPPGLLFGKPIRIKEGVEGVRFGFDPESPRRIHGRKFLEALGDAGIIHVSDYVRRIVIDASVDGAVIVYVECIGDDRLLNVVATLEGVEITGVPISEAPHAYQYPDGA